MVVTGFLILVVALARTSDIGAGTRLSVPDGSNRPIVEEWYYQKDKDCCWWVQGPVSVRVAAAAVVVVAEVVAAAAVAMVEVAVAEVVVGVAVEEGSAEILEDHRSLMA